MRYEIIYEKSVNKFLKNKCELKKKVDNAFELLSRDIFQQEVAKNLDIKKMTSLKNIYRLRLGDYRVLYTIKSDIITIIVMKIANRKDVYSKR